MNHLERIRQILESCGQRPKDVPALITSLFCEKLMWGHPHKLKPRKLKLSAPVPREVTAAPVAQMSGLPVYMMDWPDDRLPTTTARRAVQRALAPTHAEHLLVYVARNRCQLAFTWARKRPDGKIELRTLPYEVGSPARTTVERLAELAFSLDELRAGEPPITLVTDKLNTAFSVEAVTEQFFHDYRRVFDRLQQRLLKALPTGQGLADEKTWAHDYALQLLNRLMFLYFIQRKRWIGDNPRFLHHFWESYKRTDQPKDSFFSQWLKVLFFEAFNNRFHGGHHYFPEDIRSALQLAPFLNGGLFRENQIDTAYAVALPDEFFEQVFDCFDGSQPGFLERYNFTIAEYTPFDVEVAVDPEMIGKVYESLVNITFEGLTEEDLRGSAGIFYTPRIEIDLMCRLSLVDALTNHLGPEHKPLLYDAVFAYDPSDKDTADCTLAEHNLWTQLNEILRTLTICDPACGSGSFLVGMLLVLDDLQARANNQLGIEETPYERRRRIIGSQLYGVDVMDWAVHVAELRLWLQLVVETELQPAELKFRPLLPNLSLKVRQGDSLVQEIAGINFGLHRQHLDIPQNLKGRITQLKGKKLRFYQGETGINEAALKKEELDLFREILQHKIHTLRNQIAALNRHIDSLDVQTELPGLESGSMHRTRAQKEQYLRAKLEEKQAKWQCFQSALNTLKTAQDVPFVWDIAFVEIFEGNAGGFDIVIGNPPYVDRIKIAPPTLREQDFTTAKWRELKADYKDKLQQFVAATYPCFFAKRRLDGKSDLYVYFYLHGLSLVSDKGSFCFITSNSWLDVGYGKDLQEFLLKHSHVKLVLDNEVKRSFAQADVNTVIVLLAPSDDRAEWGLDQIARFVMFKKPFEEIAHAKVFKEIEAVTERRSTEAYRATARLQRELLEEGLETDVDDAGARHAVPVSLGDAKLGQAQGLPTTATHLLIKATRYIGNKWGGKYLRAPDVFFTILTNPCMMPVTRVATARLGVTTGVNEFFFVKKVAHGRYVTTVGGEETEILLPDKYLHPVLRTASECERFTFHASDTEYHILLVDRNCKDEQVRNYIRIGEMFGVHRRPFFNGRTNWYETHNYICDYIALPEIIYRRYFFIWNADRCVLNKNFYGFVSRIDEELLYGLLNFTFSFLFFELSSRKPGAGASGIGVRVANRLPIVNPDFINQEQKQVILEAAASIRSRELTDISAEVEQADRRKLDKTLLAALGFTESVMYELYSSLLRLVDKRVEKAKSV